MSRRALLIFTAGARLDLVRRRLPLATLPLLRSSELASGQISRADVHAFGPVSGSPPDRQFHPQQGRTFAERFENAIETLAALGYQEIVTVGGDCPDLSPPDVAQAFEQLNTHRLVLGPDHRGGCYLIAFRIGDRALLRGIAWKKNTDCAELRSRAGAASVALLPIKHDIDSWADLLLAARANARLARFVAFLVARLGGSTRRFTQFVHEAARFIRVHGQIPPPARVGA